MKDLANQRYKQRSNNRQQEYKRLVKNTKAKFSRLKENFGLDYSHVIEIPKFEELKTDEQFDSFVEEMESFTDRGNRDYQFDRNAKGVVYPLSLLDRGLEAREIAVEKAQEFIDKYKELEYKIGGKEVGYTVGDRMILYEKENVAGISVPEPFDIDKFESYSRIVGKVELLEEKADGIFFDRSQRTMKENFMKSIRGSFNSVADDIIDMLDAMPEDDFFELFLQTAEFTFEDYASDGSIGGTETQAEKLRGYLHEYYRGNFDNDLKFLGTLRGEDGDKVIKPNTRFVRSIRAKHGRE